MRFKVGCKVTNKNLIRKLANRFNEVDFIFIDEDILAIDLKSFDSIWYEDKFELTDYVKEFLIEFKIPFVKIEKKFSSTIYTINNERSYKNLTIDFRRDICFQMANRNHNVFSTLIELNKFVENKEKSELGHSLRVAYLSKKFAESLNISEKDSSLIYMGALFHDIGKMSIPEAILTKPARLTNEEYEVIKKHTDIGSLFLTDDFYCQVADIIRHHHERCDGKGYPDALSNDEISLGAKIVCLADSYDAMTSSRSYNDHPKSKQEALSEIVACSVENEFGGKGCQFDAILADNFCHFLNAS